MRPEAAFAELYQTHYRRVFGLCRQLLGSVDLAEDAVQEVFMRAYRGFDKYVPSRPFMAWVSTIAHNYCIDLLRRGGRTSAIFGNEGDERIAIEADGTSVLGDVLAAESAREIKSAVDELPERYRVPLVLAYYQDMSYDEIAGTLGLTTNHVGTLICRGRQKLRAALSEHKEQS